MDSRIYQYLIKLFRTKEKLPRPAPKRGLHFYEITRLTPIPQLRIEVALGYEQVCQHAMFVKEDDIGIILVFGILGPIRVAQMLLDRVSRSASPVSSVDLAVEDMMKK